MLNRPVTPQLPGSSQKPLASALPVEMQAVGCAACFGRRTRGTRVTRVSGGCRSLKEMRKSLAAYLQYRESFGLPPTAINGLNGRAQFALNSLKTLCVPGPFQHAHMHDLTMPADCVSTFRMRSIGRSNDSKYIALRSAIQSPTHAHCCMHVGQEYDTSCYVRPMLP